jgi:hypothetical protein
MHYRIVMPPHIGAAQILRQTLGWLKEEKTMQADRARLTKACCSPAKYAPSRRRTIAHNDPRNILRGLLTCPPLLLLKAASVPLQREGSSHSWIAS